MDQENSTPNYGLLLDSCDVCGGTATGEYFGTIACAACANFFEESIHNNVDYYCATKNCVIAHGTTARYCQYCYLYKCLAAGMTCGFAPRAWVRLLNRLTCGVSGSDESMSYDESEGLSEQADQKYQNSSCGTSYDARSSDVTLSILPTVKEIPDIIPTKGPTDLRCGDIRHSGGMGNVTKWQSSSISEGNEGFRDLERAGVSSGVRGSGIYRYIVGAESSNSMKDAGRPRGMETMELSNDIETAERSRDIERFGISNDMASKGRSTGIKAVEFSNVIKAAGRSTGIEAVGFSNLIKAAGKSRDIERFGISNDMASKGRSTGMEAVGFSNVIEAAGRSSGIEEMGLNSGMDHVRRSRDIANMGSSNHEIAVGTSRDMRSQYSSSDTFSTVSFSDIKNAMTSTGTKRAASSRNIQAEVISRGVNSERTSSGVECSDTTDASRVVRTSKCARISGKQEFSIPIGMTGYGIFATIIDSGFRTFGDVDCLGLSSMKLVEFSRYAENERISRSVNGTRDGIPSCKISLNLRHAKKLLDIEDFNVVCDVLTPNSLDLPLEVPSLELHGLTMRILCESSARMMFALTRWMFTLPHFLALPKPFQESLYRETWPQLFVLALARWAVPCGLHKVLAATAECIRKELKKRTQNATRSLTNDNSLILPNYSNERFKALSNLTSRLYCFIKKMDDIKVSDSEYAHLRALCLFASERAPNILTERLQEFRLNVKNSLRACIHDDSSRFIELLLQLSEINIFSDDFLEKMFFVGLLGNVCMKDAIPHILNFERELINN